MTKSFIAFVACLAVGVGLAALVETPRANQRETNSDDTAPQIAFVNHIYAIVDDETAEAIRASQ